MLFLEVCLEPVHLPVVFLGLFIPLFDFGGKLSFLLWVGAVDPFIDFDLVLFDVELADLIVLPFGSDSVVRLPIGVPVNNVGALLSFLFECLHI